MSNSFKFIATVLFLSAASVGYAAGQEKSAVMSDAYYQFWNDEIQQKIDRDIDTYRRADAVIAVGDIKKGTKVTVEQVTSDFLFGSNIFLFDQFDTPEKNERYRAVFGDLFNAATVAFYWKKLEPVKGHPRYAADSPYEYRRPATDPVVDFCESKGIIMKGHAIIYGIRSWGHPEWMPNDRKQMEAYFENHIRELAERYQSRIQSWDVVNEAINQADRGLMPDDYTYKCYINAMKYFPDGVQLNMNDCDIHWGPFPRYVELNRNLIDRGVRIDNVGVQMHIFSTNEVNKIAAGEDIMTPDKIRAVLDCLSGAERPIVISEVTITAPDDTDRGKEIQAVLTRNLYRYWFSYPDVSAITWWNLADGGAAPGEPSISGLLDKNCLPKPAYHVLDQLINHEWRTNLSLTPDADGNVCFRGFKGNYKVTWTDRKGNVITKEFHLADDGDGLKTE